MAARLVQHHYIEWRTWDHIKGVEGELKATELYDHKLDPKENTNISELEENRSIIAELAKQLNNGWQAAKPKD